MKSRVKINGFSGSLYLLIKARGSKRMREEGRGSPKSSKVKNQKWSDLYIRPKTDRTNDKGGTVLVF